jgi:peroxin-1
MPAGVYLKGCDGILKDNMPVCSLSPCHFKISGKEKAVEGNGLQVLDRYKTHKKKDMLLATGSNIYIDVVDWSTHDKFFQVNLLAERMKCLPISLTREID